MNSKLLVTAEINITMLEMFGKESWSVNTFDILWFLYNAHRLDNQLKRIIFFYHNFSASKLKNDAVVKCGWHWRLLP